MCSRCGSWKYEMIENGENPVYRKVTKEEATWTPSRINQGWEMARINPQSNMVEVRHLNLWERIIYWKF